MFETIEAWSGTSGYKGKYVPNPGKANGIIVRRAVGTKKGTKFNKIELREVFKSKEGKWKIQCGREKPGPYGHMKWVTFQKDTLRGVIECLSEVYAEIYGKTAVDIGKQIASEMPPMSAPRKEIAKSEQLEELEKLGY